MLTSGSTDPPSDRAKWPWAGIGARQNRSARRGLYQRPEVGPVETAATRPKMQSAPMIQMKQSVGSAAGLAARSRSAVPRGRSTGGTTLGAGPLTNP